jgi:hypothetical protein
MVKHAAEVRMVVRLTGRELLDLFGVALNWKQVEVSELRVGEGGVLPDAIEQLTAVLDG